MRVLIMIATMSLFAQVSSAKDLYEKSVGTAVNKSGKVIYIEKHTSLFTNGELKYLGTNYFNNKGKNFGHIKSDFSKNKYLPSYQFVDDRHGRMAEIKWKGDLVLAIAKEKKSSEKKIKEFSVKGDTVAGQGLHNYLRKNLSTYIKDTSHSAKINFLVPMNQDVYDFRIRAQKVDTAKRTITLRIEADSWFFRLLAPHIDVTYSLDSKRLLVYEGPSNLLNDKGDKTNVTINYIYNKS